MTDSLSAAKPITLEHLSMISDQMPPSTAAPNFEDVIYQDTVEAVYNTFYAPALNKFLETRWYTESGLDSLRRDSQLLSEFVAFFRAAEIGPEDPSPPNLLAQETRLIWNLLSMCCAPDIISPDFNSPNVNMTAFTNEEDNLSAHLEERSGHDERITNNGTEVVAVDLNTQEAGNERPHHSNNLTVTSIIHQVSDSAASVPATRLKALSSLLTYPSHSQTSGYDSIKLSNPLPSHSTSSPPLTHQLQARQNDFWSSIGRYLNASATIDEKPLEAETEIKAALSRARALLDGFENRDVVYTIMKCRSLQTATPTRRIPDPALDPDLGDEHETNEERKDQEAAREERKRIRQWHFCIDVLKNEAALTRTEDDWVPAGVGKNVVAMRIAAMALRAFQA